MAEVKNIDLGNAPVGKTFISYAVPSVLGMVMLSMAGIIDGLFIGRYVGTDALAGVSIVFPITSLAIGFAIMIGTGGTTTASAEIGAGQYQIRQEYLYDYHHPGYGMCRSLHRGRLCFYRSHI